MEKEHDFLMTMLANPGDITIGEYKEAGYTPANTGLALESVYANSEKIQNNPYFLKEDGSFDKDKFHNFYNGVLTSYNLLADDSYVENLKEHTLYDAHNIFVDWNKTTKDTPLFQLVKAFNPDRQTYSMNRIGQQGPRVWSMDEIAQTQLLEDWNTKKKGKSPNDLGFFGNFFDTMVLATWDYDADENGNPTNDPEKIVYQKGTPKLNENGTYYYETLGGRSIYGKQVLNRANILTTDGSALNRFDIFDTDDIKLKSFTGAVLRQAALVGTMFIPGIGYIIAGLSMGTQLAGLMATAAKMFAGNDHSILNSVEGWVQSMDRQSGRTEESQLNMWTLENMVGLIGDVAGLLKEQRFIFKYLPALFRPAGLNAKTQEAFKNAVRKSTLEDLLAGKDAITVLRELNAAMKYLAAEEIAELRAARALTEYMKTSGKIGSIISKGYMTGITVADTYGEALQAGADQQEAALLTIGYAAAEAALLNTDIGEWILPELKANKIRERALAEALAGVRVGESYTATSLRALEGEGRRQYAKRLMKAGWEAGERNARSLLTRKGAGKYIASSLSSGLGEATEEVTEELLADFSKQCFNWAKGKNVFENPWENWQERYLMSGLGGFMGGSLTALGTDFSKESLIKHDYTFNLAMQEAIWMVRNGEDGKFLRELKNKTLGSKDLSTKTDENGNYLPGTSTDNQDLAVKLAIANNFQLIHNILETQGAKLSDESFFSQITNDDMKDLKMQLLVNAQERTGAAGRLLQRYNTLLAEIVSLSSNPTEKTDTQKLQERKEGITDEQDAKRKELLKEKQQELQDLLSGKNLGSYFEDALFELSIGINEAFAHDVVTFRGYVEYKTGKKPEELSEAERQTYTQEYVEYAKGNRADDVSMRARMYHEAAIKASEALKKGEAFFDKLAYSSEGESTVALLKNRNALFTQALLLAKQDPQELLTIAQELIADTTNAARKIAGGLVNNGVSAVDSTTEALQKALAMPGTNDAEIAARTEAINKASTDYILDSMRQIIAPYAGAELEYIHPEVKEQLEQLITTYDLFRKNLRWSKLVSKIELALKDGKLTDFSGNVLSDNKIGLQNFIRKMLGAELSGDKLVILDNTPMAAAKKSDDPVNALLTVLGISEAMGNDSTVPVNAPDASGNYSGNIIQAAATRHLDEIAGLLGNDTSRAVEKFLIDLVENSEEGTIAQRDDVNFWRTTLDNAQYTPLVEMLKDFVVTNDQLSKTAKDIYLSALSKVQEFKEDLSQITLTPDETYALEQTLKLATLFLTAIFGARTDKGDLTNLWGGYNATVNQFHKGEDGYNPLAEIDHTAADYMSLDMELVTQRIGLLLGIHTANATSKLNGLSKVALNQHKLILVQLRSKLMDVALPDELKGAQYNQLVKAIEGATTINGFEAGNPPILSEELKIQVEREMLDIQDAWHVYYNEVLGKLPNGLVNFLKNFKLDQEVTTTDETSKAISDPALMWWLAARGGVQATNFYTKYKDTITEDIAPLSLQEAGTYLCYAFTTAKDVFDKFIAAVKKIQKENWDNGGWDAFVANNGLTEDDIKSFGSKYKENGYMIVSDLPILNKMLLIQGIAGAGKTKAVLTSYVKMLKATHTDILSKAWVVAPRASGSSESTLANNIGLDSVKQFTHKNLLEHIQTSPHSYSNSDLLELKLGEELEIAPDGSIQSKGDLNLFTDDNVPSVIIIDEIGKYNYEQLSAINRFANAYGVQIIALGDLSQTTPRGVVTLETKKDGKPMEAYVQPLAKSFIQGQKMGTSMRTDNTYMGGMVQMLHKKIETKEISNIGFKYTENDKGLFGVKVFEGTPDTSDTNLKYTDKQLKAIYDNLVSLSKTLKTGEKIGFIYTSTNSPLYLAIAVPSGKYYNPDLLSKIDLYEGTAQGFENQYFLAELYSLDVSDETFLSNLYTDISRAKQGAIVVTPSARQHELSQLPTPIKSEIKKIESAFSSEPPEADRYTKEGVANYARNRKKVLEAALQGRTSSTPTGTTPPAGPTPPSAPPAGPSSPTGPPTGGGATGGGTTGGTSGSSTGSTSGTTGGSSSGGSPSLVAQLSSLGFTPKVSINVNGSRVSISAIDETLVVATYASGAPYIEPTDVFLGKVKSGEITIAPSFTITTPTEMLNDLDGRGYKSGTYIRLGSGIAVITDINTTQVTVEPGTGAVPLSFKLKNFYDAVSKGNYQIVSKERANQEHYGLVKGALISDNGEVVTIVDIDDTNMRLADSNGNVEVIEMDDFWAEWHTRFTIASTEVPDTSMNEDEEHSNPDQEELVLGDSDLQKKLTPANHTDEFITEEASSEPAPSGYSFNTFHPGRVIENGKWAALNAEDLARAEQRRDGINGLEWIHRTTGEGKDKGKGVGLNKGKKLDVDTTIQVLRNILLIMLSNKTKAQKEAEVRAELATLFLSKPLGKLTIKYGFKSSSRPNTKGKKYGTELSTKDGKVSTYLGYDYSSDEKLLLNPSAEYDGTDTEDNEQVSIPRKHVGAYIFLDNKLALEIPLFTLGNAITIIQNSDYYSALRGELNRLKTDTAGDFHKIVTGMINYIASLPDRNKYTKLFKLLYLFNKTNNDFCFLDDSVVQDHMYTGILYASVRGTHQINEKLQFGTFKTLSELAKYGLHTSDVLVSTTDITAPDGKLIIKKGHPYVLASYTMDTLNLETLKNNPKEIMIIRVIPPKVTASQYLDNIIAVMQNAPSKRKDIGDRFTIVKVWELVISALAGQNLPHINSANNPAMIAEIEKIVKKIGASSGLSVKDKFTVLSEVKDWSQFDPTLKRQLTTELFLVRALYSLFLKPPYAFRRVGSTARTAEMQQLREFLERTISGVDIYLRVKKDKNTIGQECPVINMKKEQVRIHGKVDPPQYNLGDATLQIFDRFHIPGPSDSNATTFNPSELKKGAHYPSELKNGSPAQSEAAIATDKILFLHPSVDLAGIREVGSDIEGNPGTKSFLEEFTERYNQRDYGFKTYVYKGQRYFIKDVQSVDVTDGALTVRFNDDTVWQGALVDGSGLVEVFKVAPITAVTRTVGDIKEQNDAIGDLLEEFADDAVVTVEDGVLAVNGTKIEGLELDDLDEQVSNFIKDYLEESDKNNNCAPKNLKLL